MSKVQISGHPSGFGLQWPHEARNVAVRGSRCRCRSSRCTWSGGCLMRSLRHLWPCGCRWLGCAESELLSALDRCASCSRSRRRISSIRSSPNLPVGLRCHGSRFHRGCTDVGWSSSVCGSPPDAGAFPSRGCLSFALTLDATDLAGGQVRLSAVALILEVDFEGVPSESVAQRLVSVSVERLVARHPWTPALLQLDKPLVLTFVGCGVVGREVAAGGQVAVNFRGLHRLVGHVLSNGLRLLDLLA
mmetsp:Transcript_50792/g.119164  ORF Transcript_50792/g.119164 Transcript_50792/m.119164 type:complete len:246 (-) Transcript_50792:279-1016(-)